MTGTAMRISFELAREDNPPLFDELARFPKGPRRVNRLRTLAHEGLIVQQAGGNVRAAAAGSAASVTKSGKAPADRIDALGAASLELFSGPADE